MTGTCAKCHRPLSDPVSVERGFGPTCYGAVTAESKRPFTDDPADESDFDYRIDRSAAPVLVITDLDRGGRSVTNNIEAILNRIATDEGIDTQSTLVVYRDSSGDYDGVRIDERGHAHIYPLVKSTRITDEHEAIQAARKETA